MHGIDYFSMDKHIWLGCGFGTGSYNLIINFAKPFQYRCVMVVKSSLEPSMSMGIRIAI